MDMKRILQAMDGVATKPVVGVNAMKKFLQAVTEEDLNQTEAVGDPANIADQVNSYIQYSSGLYQKGLSSIEIKKGLVLPITFTPIPPNGDSFKIIQANLNAANARLPKELQLAPDQLSAIVGGADKPYAGISANTPYTGPTLNEGTNPHKVALPVQMAMQHYQEVAKVATTPINEKKSSIKTFFKEVQLESEEEALAKRQIRNQYAQQIAERVLMKENTVPGHTAGFKPGPGPGLQSNTSEMAIVNNPADPNNPVIHSHEKANPMHLKDRIMSARAQLRELAQLAESNDLLVWERITRLAKGGMFMGLEQNLEQIRHGINELAKKRKQGGIASRGIDKNLGEFARTDDEGREFMSWQEFLAIVTPAMKHWGFRADNKNPEMMYSRRGRSKGEMYFIILDPQDDMVNHSFGTMEDHQPDIHENGFVSMDKHGAKVFLERADEAYSLSDLKQVAEGFGEFPNTKQPKAPLAKPKTIKSKSKTGACRTGQTQTGMQNKNGKMVPKCSVQFKK